MLDRQVCNLKFASGAKLSSYDDVAQHQIYVKDLKTQLHFTLSRTLSLLIFKQALTMYIQLILVGFQFHNINDALLKFSWKPVRYQQASISVLLMILLESSSLHCHTAHI